MGNMQNNTNAGITVSRFQLLPDSSKGSNKHNVIDSQLRHTELSDPVPLAFVIENKCICSG